MELMGNSSALRYMYPTAYLPTQLWGFQMQQGANQRIEFALQ
jgi:hypothetical protein